MPTHDLVTVSEPRAGPRRRMRENWVPPPGSEIKGPCIHSKATWYVPFFLDRRVHLGVSIGHKYHPITASPHDCPSPSYPDENARSLSHHPSDLNQRVPPDRLGSVNEFNLTLVTKCWRTKPLVVAKSHTSRHHQNLASFSCTREAMDGREL